MKLCVVDGCTRSTTGRGRMCDGHRRRVERWGDARPDLPLAHRNRPSSTSEWAGTQYQDTGCRLHPSCLKCPRAVCIEDEREVRPALEKKERDMRDEAIIRLRNTGLTTRRVAAELGLTRGVVEGVLRKVREAS